MRRFECALVDPQPTQIGRDVVQLHRSAMDYAVKRCYCLPVCHAHSKRRERERLLTRQERRAPWWFDCLDDKWCFYFWLSSSIFRCVRLVQSRSC